MMLTWWIPRTASLIQVGRIGGGGSRVPSWIAFRAKEKSSHCVPEYPPTHTPTGEYVVGAGCAQMVVIPERLH